MAIVAAPLVVMGAIFFLSSRSQLPDLDGGRDIQSLAGHFVAYAALGASLAVLFRVARAGARMRALFAAIVLATLYGITDEFHQSFVPNRQTDVKDVLVDFLGACRRQSCRHAAHGLANEPHQLRRRMLSQSRRRTRVPDESGQRDQREQIRQRQQQLGRNTDPLDLRLNLERLRSGEHDDTRPASRTASSFRR